MQPPDALADLHQALMICDSATAVLEQFFGGPVMIRRLPVPPSAPDAAQRARLQLDDGAAWAHRRVHLVAHGAILSDADLWYVPGRLVPAMVKALATSNTPFGVIVRPLRPRRVTLAASRNLLPGAVALDHRALLMTEMGPIAEVHERYTHPA